MLLPKFIAAFAPKPFNSLTVALAITLSLTTHGTGAAIRRTAAALHRRAKDHKAKLKTLADVLTDDEALRYGVNMANAVTRALGITPERPFEYVPDAVLTDPPKCHWKPMRLAGAPGQRHWKCQHCTHTKPLELPYDQPN